MRKKGLFIGVVFILFSTFTLVSCGDEENNTNNENTTEETEDVVESDDINSDNNGCYSIKSGIIEYSTEALGTENLTTIYFDDYGNMEEIVMTIDAGYMQTNMRSFIKNGFFYTLDLENNTGTKRTASDIRQASNSSMFSPKQMTDEQKKLFDVKEEGTAVVLGKTCDVFSTIGIGDERSKFYIYKDVVLKTEMGKLLVYEASKFEENASMPDWFYVIPDEIEIKEVN